MILKKVVTFTTTGEIYACKLAADMFKLKKDDFSEHVKDIITVGDH